MFGENGSFLFVLWWRDSTVRHISKRGSQCYTFCATLILSQSSFCLWPPQPITNLIFLRVFLWLWCFGSQFSVHTHFISRVVVKGQTVEKKEYWKTSETLRRSESGVGRSENLRCDVNNKSEACAVLGQENLTAWALERGPSWKTSCVCPAFLAGLAVARSLTWKCFVGSCHCRL